MDTTQFIILFIIALPVYLILGRLLNKTNMQTGYRKLSAFAGTLVITPLVYTVVFYAVIFSMSWHPSHEFDHEEWHTEPGERYEMSRHIIESDLLIGKTKEEVRDLLGSDYYEYDSDHWGYDLGFVSPFPVDPEILNVRFKDGKVVDVGQHRG